MQNVVRPGIRPSELTDCILFVPCEVTGGGLKSPTATAPAVPAITGVLRISFYANPLFPRDHGVVVPNMIFPSHLRETRFFGAILPFRYGLPHRVQRGSRFPSCPQTL